MWLQQGFIAGNIRRPPLKFNIDIALPVGSFLRLTGKGVGHFHSFLWSHVFVQQSKHGVTTGKTLRKSRGTEAETLQCATEPL